jgi:modulator of FtsH protease
MEILMSEVTARPNRVSPHPAGYQQSAQAGGEAVTSATLLGQVMSLVALAIGFLVLGTIIGRDLSRGASITLSLIAFGMLFVQALGGEHFRVGRFAIGWLFAVALVIGLGFGPVLAYYASADPTAITEAAGATALVVAAMGAGGVLIGRDLAGWLRPLTFAIFGLVIVSFALVLFGGGGSSLLSLAIAAVSALLLLVDFNYLRRHGTEDDVVLLATGIFISIVNIFLSLLNIFSQD